MKIAGTYSFNKGREVIDEHYSDLLEEICEAVKGIDASICKTKESEEKTMPGQMLYSPKALNTNFKDRLYPKGWRSVRVSCDYPVNIYTPEYKPKKLRKGAFREMDFVKRKLGLEVQLGGG